MIFAPFPLLLLGVVLTVQKGLEIGGNVRKTRGIASDYPVGQSGGNGLPRSNTPPARGIHTGPSIHVVNVEKI